jgi:lipoprotein NlpI
MRAVLASAAAVAALVFTDAAFGANQKDLQECASSEPDRSIAGCTRLLADRSETTQTHAEAYTQRAAAWLAKGDLDGVIADCNEAIRLDPKSVTAYGYRGVAWRQKGDFARAIADYTTAIRLDPNNATLRTNRGLAYFAKGDFSAAVTNLRPSIESKNYAYLILFQYLARTRAGETAVTELATSAALLKSTEWPFAAIELHLGRRSPEATLAAAGDANALCEAQFYVGEWHLLRGDRANARSALQIAVDTCPKHFVEYSAAIAELKQLTP